MEIINFIIIVLLGITLIFAFVNYRANITNNTREKALPASIDKATANKIIDDIKNAYNSGNNDELYNIIGDYSKTLFTYSDFEESMSNIKILGKMEKASYANYSYLQNDNGSDIFLLNYTAKFEAGNGRATVTIMVNNNEWEVAGFRFYVDNMKEIIK